jgi:uncharacterized protein (TIGR04255 family)
VPFPESPRVIYEHNPLADVICQLRFPAVLRVDAEIPAPFQERVRDTFPVFTETAPPDPINLPPNIPRPVAEQLAQQVAAVRAATMPPKAYNFATEDGQWTLSLSRESMSLTCKRYRRWEEFRELLTPAVTALQEEYRPAYFSRVGLRYQDVICRTDLDLTVATPWSDLIRPAIAGELGAPEISGEVTLAARQLLVRLPVVNGKVLLQHGLGRKDLSTEVGEECFVIDADYFTDDRTEVLDALTTLNALNGQAGRLFRWCITDRLHDALLPRVVA